MMQLENMQIQYLLSRYAEILKDFFGKRLLSVAIFGSVARGTAEFPQSDIDILIVVRDVENLSFGERVRQTMKAEEELSKTEEFIKFKDTFGCRPNSQEIILGNEGLKYHFQYFSI